MRSKETLTSESYRDLIAWQKAMDLTLATYRATSTFPKDEKYGLTSQMRRAAVSVPSNIAEGKGRHSTKELVQFLYRARGSLLELQTQVSIARELNYLDIAAFRNLNAQADEIGRVLNGLINRFQSQIERSS